jgi:hypothetical protein
MLTKEEAKEYWYEKQRVARQTMDGRKGCNGILIECASKVLEDGLHPDFEFRARLNRTIELYHELRLENEVVHIYVPGSLHKENVSTGSTQVYETDQCTLSTAGRRYLVERGIPDEIILGDRENERYKGDEGVLNSADECFVASRIFFDGQYRELHCVCSPIQVTRKWFYYLEFGLIPLIHCVPVVDSDVMDIVTEQLRGTENVIYNDHNAQSHDSEVWINSRKERKGK